MYLAPLPGTIRDRLRSVREAGNRVSHPVRPANVTFHTYRTPPRTDVEVIRRASEVRSEICGKLPPPGPDDVSRRPDVVAGVGWNHAPERPTDDQESLAETCRRYLREWRALRRRWRRDADRKRDRDERGAGPAKGRI